MPRGRCPLPTFAFHRLASHAMLLTYREETGRKRRKRERERERGIERELEVMASTADQVIKCRTTVSWEAGKPLMIEEVEVVPPQVMEVRLKILYTSLCHTDVYFWAAKGQTPLFPRIFSHEAGGIVESVGEGVTDLPLGDHVLPIFTGDCKECAHCKSQESNMCDLLRINTE